MSNPLVSTPGSELAKVISQCEQFKGRHIVRIGIDISVDFPVIVTVTELLLQDADKTFGEFVSRYKLVELPSENEPTGGYLDPQSNTPTEEN